MSNWTQEAAMKQHLLAGLLGLAAVGALAHDDEAKKQAYQQLGNVQFANSCSPAVQQKLLRGIAMLHSFWFSAAEETFQQVGAEDNQCVLAAWGFASILMANPLDGAGPPAKQAPRAQAAIEKGRQMSAKTQRERDYLEAVAAYYEDFANRPERVRSAARASAYAALAAKYPDDDEAQIFYALYLASTQLQSDQTYAVSLKAAAILEREYAKYPDHPGVAHYLIHTYDAPPIAHQGVSAAKRYASIAPDAPHALHMPSHIFTRVGAWSESAATNRRAADVALKGNEPDQALHAMDYMTYAYLQLARDADARKVYEEALRVTGTTVRQTAPYAVAAMQARYAVERGAWSDAARLEPLPIAKLYPFAEANTYLARALGGARSGNPAAGRADLAQITQRRDALKEAKNEYWASEVEVMRLTASGWIALAEGRPEQALTDMRQAADLEDRNDKHLVTPGRILPARELLGELLLQLKRPAEALQAFEASQAREPNRFRGLYGAALAATQAGERAKAKLYFRRLVDLAAQGDMRAELGAARSWLARNP
jgi:tetratricopeptide (TPR) repeat protein